MGGCSSCKRFEWCPAQARRWGPEIEEKLLNDDGWFESVIKDCFGMVRWKSSKWSDLPSYVDANQEQIVKRLQERIDPESAAPVQIEEVRLTVFKRKHANKYTRPTRPLWNLGVDRVDSCRPETAGPSADMDMD